MKYSRTPFCAAIKTPRQRWDSKSGVSKLNNQALSQRIIRGAYTVLVSCSPPPSEVWAGYERKGKPSIGTESLMHPSPVRCTLQSAGRSLKKICTVSQGYRSARQDPVQNMYAVYKMRVISQNSRRKAGAEDVCFLGQSS
jgi:hypothetical protein